MNNNINCKRWTIKYFIIIYILNKVIRIYIIWPERLWTLHEQIEVKRNFNGRSLGCWRANRSDDLCKAAKDSSNNLVAGFIRNISQDSCNSGNSYI